MATTELHKVPETILSRCQEFEFRTIPLQKIFDRLKLIANAEKIDISDDALRELARSGDGSMRDAQSNFDQVISFSSDKISAADVTNALGFAGVEILTKTINAITIREPKGILSVVDDIISRGHDMRNFCRDLLGLFRDLLVYKVSGGDKQLLEGAVFSDDEMRAMAEGFGEADLLRFFNSLCETEANLREAAHPRYVLEIGLVKLIEMRKVVTIESILERLNALSTGMPAAASSGLDTSIAAVAQTAPVQEKKTLKTEKPDYFEPTPADEPPIFSDDPGEPPEEFVDFDEPVFEQQPSRTTEPKPYETDIIRLLPLSAAELEHFDDPKLDDAYEEKLALAGDDLLPLVGAKELIASLFGEEFEKPAPRPYPASNGSAAAVVPAFDVEKLRNEISPPEPDVPLPVLGPEPTDLELLAYARAHPAVRAAMRIFRGNIVEVKKV